MNEWMDATGVSGTGRPVALLLHPAASSAAGAVRPDLAARGVLADGGHHPRGREQGRRSGPRTGLAWHMGRVRNGYCYCYCYCFLGMAQVAAKKSGRAAALVADEELTREDRQRLRRAAKSSAKKDKAAALEQAGPDSEARLQDQLRADKRVVLAADDDKSKGKSKGKGGAGRSHGHGDQRRRPGGGGGGDSLSKSAAFFAQLQRQTQAQIQSKSQDKKSLKRKAEAQLLPSHSFKL